MEGEEILNNFKVGSLPTVYYIPDFITDIEQEQLLNNIYQAPVSKWKSLKNRRLQDWGGVVHEKGLLPQDLPTWLKRITERIFNQTQLFPSAINHVLINEYFRNQGIMPHQDGPAYFPVVAILSLESPVVMNFTPHSSLQESMKMDTNNGDVELSDANQSSFSVLLMPCSLLIFKDDAYSNYLHGISDDEIQKCDKIVNADKLLVELDLNSSGDGNFLHRSQKRVSLTCRVVSKVHKKLFKF